MDTDDNHHRLGEIRAGELERAMGALGVTEWENLGYRDSGMMSTDGNHDPRNFWKADLDEAAGRLTWLIRRYRPDVVTTYNDFGGYGHPDHIRTHDVAVRAFDRAGDPAWYPEQLDGTEVEPWSPAKLYEQAIAASARRLMAERMKERGQRSWWEPPEDATPEQVAEFEAFAAKMLTPDEAITTRIDIADALDAKWAALREHVTQIGPENPFMLLGVEGWRELGSQETYILRQSRVETALPETDLFAGIV
jgi:N-acetyl-1-D-myo-inositol-2-amino-2-deoxy-alpha-D-glucopyranoside deacetylase